MRFIGGVSYNLDHFYRLSEFVDCRVFDRNGNMLSSTGRNILRRLDHSHCIRRYREDIFQQIRWMAMRPNSSRGKVPLALAGIKEAQSEWWVVDGEIHEIGDNVPPRERFVIPRDNIPNRRRKQMREQFMRRTRLVLRETVRRAIFLKIRDFAFGGGCSRK